MSIHGQEYSRGKISYRGSYRTSSKSCSSQGTPKRHLSESKGEENPSKYLMGADEYPDFYESDSGCRRFIDVNSDEITPLGLPSQYSYHHKFYGRASREHDVAVLAVNFKLKTYAQVVVDALFKFADEKVRIYFKERQGRGSNPRIFRYRPPKVFQVALANEGLVESCVLDLSDMGCLLAIILNDANRKHGSCTLRILHSGQEHRNMPMSDAMELLFNCLYGYLLAENKHLSSVSPHISPALAVNNNIPPQGPSNHLPLPSVLRSSEVPKPRHIRETPIQRRSSPLPHDRNANRRKRQRSSRPSSYSSSWSSRYRRTSTGFFLPSPFAQNHCCQRQNTTPHSELPDPGDPSFLAPSKRISVLLRMLADSRILSAAELEEIATFISERKARLNREVKITACEGVHLSKSCSPIWMRSVNSP